MTDQISIEDFLREDEIAAVSAPVAPSAGDLGPVLLAILPCTDVPTGVISGLPSYLEVRFKLDFASFPVMLPAQLVATVWRLAVGTYKLEIALLDYTGNVLAECAAELVLESPMIYTCLLRFVDVTISAPGLYGLAARCTPQGQAGVLGAVVPFAIEEG